MHSSKLALLASMALAFAPASATEVARHSPYDSRIKTVVYNPSDVTLIYGVVGVATHIILQEGEEYGAHSFGDGGAWAFAHYQNHLFVKPAAENGDTNLTVITNRHVYEFALRYVADHSSGDATFQLKFAYPVEEAAARAKAEQVRLDAVRVTDALAHNPPAQVNLSYTMNGAMSLAPVNVWDDGAFTYFKFPGNRDVPTIFVVNPDKTESIVNRVSRGAGNDVVVMQKVSRKWVLRLGKLALSVHNEKFDPIGATNTTGTASPAIVRAVRDDVPAQPLRATDSAPPPPPARIAPPIPYDTGAALAPALVPAVSAAPASAGPASAVPASASPIGDDSTPKASNP